MPAYTRCLIGEKPIPLKKESPRLEDYLETIYHLIDEKGYASSVEISDSLQVKPPTVIRSTTAGCNSPRPSLPAPP